MLMRWEEGVIRWLSTNSTMLHLGSSSSSSRHHEICVYSYPFIRLCRILLWTKADGRSDSEWPDAWDSQNRGYKRLQETGGSMETTEQNKMCWWTDALKSPEPRDAWGKIKHLKFILKQLVYKTIFRKGKLKFQVIFINVYISFSGLSLVLSRVWSFSMLWRVFTCCGFCQCFQHGVVGN